MARKVRNTIIYVPLCILFSFLIIYRHLLLSPHPVPLSILSTTTSSDHRHLKQLLPPPASATPFDSAVSESADPPVSYSLSSPPLIDTVSVFLPDWEVLVIVSPDDTPLLTESDHYLCLYPNNDVSPAKPLGLLTSPPNRAAFKCLLPDNSRRKLPFLQPILTEINLTNPLPQRNSPPATELLRWSHIVYDSSVTDNDVVLFAKGLNNRQGINHDPSEFRCLFYRENDLDHIANGVRTIVTSSIQEVFRCKLPQLTPSPSAAGAAGEDRIKVTIETVQNHHVIPTIAYFSHPIQKLSESSRNKSLLCACTMVYNVAKFLKEWVAYHSTIGIQKFILYDNESDDNLKETVQHLNQLGYDVNIYHWSWPKSQEAGFSHSVLYAKDSCTWMAYIDVDEFLYSPSWSLSPKPFTSMLPYHISKHNTSNTETRLLGQLEIGCNEFGPSNQTVHPVMGVTQGYNCRRKYENRHKSIVLIEAIDGSLHNSIHHFSLKPGYLTKKVGIGSMAVNHYKYQAWPEFKAKFRRRVSAYVVDWTNELNPNSNDRTPGLGFSAIEPPDWPLKFCNVYDNGLRELTRKWFGLQSPEGFKLAWQR